MTQKVLLVDDDPRFLKTFGELLGKDFTTLQALGQEQAVEMLTKDPEIDVVIAELFLKPVDGIDFLIRAHKIAPWCVGIIISGRPTIDKVMSAVNKANIFGIFIKTDPISSLMERIKDGLKLVSKNRTKFSASGKRLSKEELIFFQTFQLPQNKDRQ